MTITSGTRLGRYEIRSKIGAGGMGEVYRARDTDLGRDVAVKVLPSSLSSDTDRLQHSAGSLCGKRSQSSEHSYSARHSRASLFASLRGTTARRGKSTQT